jgi:serine/threonine protein kinase
MEIASNTRLVKTGEPLTYKAFFMDYKALFISREIPFELKASRIVIGQFSSEPEWLLYITVIKPQLEEALEIVLPLILNGEIAAAAPEHSQMHGMLLDGSLGFQEVGKVIYIRVIDKDRLYIIAKELIERTQTLKGPEIPGIHKLGGCIYTEFNIAPFTDQPGKYQVRGSAQRWPFGRILPFKTAKPLKWLARKYLLVHTLKYDTKGSVYKALNLSNWFNIKWCVVKEGRMNQCLDDFGRSIVDRLQWQAFVQQQFSEDCILPKVVDAFLKEDNAYLIMELIDGVAFNDKVSEIQEGIIYHQMTLNNKEKLIKLIQQLITLIEKFHSKGYLHRDISPINFMVRDTGELVAIDVELAYNYNEDVPSPWFALGTEGYMSPGQATMQHPEIEDDIYSLGGMLIRTFTGISPIKFDYLTSADQLCNHLNYFINDHRLANLLVQCRDHTSSLRPAISSIIHTLDLSQVRLITGNDKHPENPNTKLRLEEIIDKAVQGFLGSPLIGPNSIWYAKAREADGQSKVFSFYPDLYNGVAGVLYTLSKLELAGFQIDLSNTIIQANLEKLMGSITDAIKEGLEIPGLFRGHPGIALSIAQLIHAGQLERSIQHLNLITTLLKANYIEDISIDSGLAGLGIAIMKVSRLLNFPAIETDLRPVILQILNSQSKDGSWDINDLHKRDKTVTHGLLHGITGVAYFLLSYGYEYDHEPSKRAALKALGYLEKQLIYRADVFHIPPVSRTSNLDPWMESGFSGIAYLFIRAYEYGGAESSKEIATKLLENHPVDITSNYIGQANGISGIGELYLEAWRVFKSDIWMKRAIGIGSLLAHTFCCTKVDGVYWLEGNDNSPSPGFMNGNAGILHFLARLNAPNTIDFPFIHI